MPFELRDYQQCLISQAQEHLRIGGVPCIVAPTGSGKSVLLAELARLALERGERVVTVAHRHEIIIQIVKSLRAHLGTRVGIEVVTAGSTARWNRQITVGMVPTLARRTKHLGALAGCTLLQDECHHAGATSWVRVTEALRPGRRAGLTATPVRPNGNGLGDEGGFETLDRMAIHRVGRPVASEEGFTEVAREAGLAQIEAAGAGTTAVIGEGMGDFVGEVLV